MRKAAKIINFIVVTVLVCTIVLMLYGKISGMRMFTVLTGSMEPDLPVGSVIVTMPVGLEELKAGDDIAYVLNEDLTVVTHRVVRVDLTEEKVVTQGTANKMEDQPVSHRNVIGRVVYHIPLLGHVLVHFSTIKGKVIGVTVLAAVWLILTLFSNVKKSGTGDTI